VNRRAPGALVATALLAACAPRLAREARTEELTLAEARFRLVYGPEDAAAAADVRRAVETAAPRVARWGGLRRPVTITIHPSHAALERAVHRPGYAWLRAWARFDTIELQSPRTWGLLGASERKLRELVTHELTHCAMYQLAGDEQTWMYKDIPRWFSEGIASVTAAQGYRHGGIETLWAFYAEQPPGSGDGVPGAPWSAEAIAGDPIVDPDPLYQERSDLVYGAAHHAAEFLIARYGEATVRGIMRRMGEGLAFPSAFEAATGLTDAEFASDFRRYVVWQGWRRR
jgi:hypothetical protein